VSEQAPLTTTNLTAAATSCLLEHGYTQIEEKQLGSATEAGRFYEDEFGIVLVAVYETWGDLSSGWQEAQATLVELISQHMSKVEPKAWDGYLVLLTPAPSTAGREAVDAIRYDTSRLRKLVADGEELRSLGSVEDALLPLLPLQPVLGPGSGQSALDLLPELLERHAIEPRVTEKLIEAFSDDQPLVEGLHQLGEPK